MTTLAPKTPAFRSSPRSFVSLIDKCSTVRPAPQQQKSAARTQQPKENKGAHQTVEPATAPLEPTKPPLQSHQDAPRTHAARPKTNPTRPLFSQRSRV